MATVSCRIDQWGLDRLSGAASHSGAQGALMLGGRELCRFTADQPTLDGEANGFSFDLTGFPRSLARELRIKFDGLDELVGHPERSPSDLDLTPYHSLFGGMWVDRQDWEDILASKVRKGLIDEELHEQINHFVREGYAIFPRAVSQELVDRLNDDVERVWRGEVEQIFIETFSHEPGVMHILPATDAYRYGVTKLLDIHSRRPSARAATRVRPVRRFLEAIFEEKPRAFQQLHFTLGSQQAIHKDTAYVRIDTAPMKMAASWLALEDIHEGTGELEYYAGSHRSPDYLWGGYSKWMDVNPAEHDHFLKRLHDDARDYAQKKTRFLARAGDVLIWHADLAHGGAAVVNKAATRKSLVTHYTGASDHPWYFRHHQRREVEEDGMVFCSNYADVI